jgi:hypothetical protein
MGRYFLLIAPLVLGLSAPAMAAPASATATITVSGTVAGTCHLGAPNDATLSLGSLVNTADGTLNPAIPTASTTIPGSWCNTGSKISISATPLVALGFSGAPPAGFTKAVNYTATASGWTGAGAAFTTNGDTSGVVTGSATPGSQTQNDPEANSIVVALSAYASPASGARLVADPHYQGIITVTLQTTAAGG